MIADEVALQASSALIIDARALELTDEQFFQLCQDNRDLRFEMTADGEIIIMPPTGSDTGERNSELNYQLRHWTKQDATGKCFDSSTAFTLPNGAKRSPDASWIRKERDGALTPDQRKRFAPICPDFVVELRSESDTLNSLHEKMREYIENGAHLGWLIDPVAKRVYIYRPSHAVECLEQPEAVAAGPVLRGFVLRMQDVW